MNIILKTEKELIFEKNNVKCKVDLTGYTPKLSFYNSEGVFIKDAYQNLKTPEEIIAKYPDLFYDKYIIKVPKGTEIIKFSEVNKELHLKRGGYEIIYDDNEKTYYKLKTYYNGAEIAKNVCYFNIDYYEHIYKELLKYPATDEKTENKKMCDLVNVSQYATGNSGNFQNYFYKPAVVSYIVHPYEAIFLVKGARKYFVFKVTQTLSQTICEETKTIKTYFDMFNRLKKISNNSVQYMDPTEKIKSEIIAKLV